jgi:uncharacterized protein (TIGR02996 family)
MSDEDSLFRAICAEPDEDTPRLVYADCLQESGEPAKVARAEFIRLQCRADRHDPTLRDLRKRRERHLLRRWRSAWAEGLSARVKNAHYVRGFPLPELKPTPQKFLALAEADLAGAPRWHLEIDWLTDPRFILAAESPLLARFDLAYLETRAGPVPPAHVRALAASPQARSLRVLHVDMPAGGAGLAELAASESLAGLTSLWPRGNALGPHAVRLLAGASFAPGLQSLTLQEGLLTPDAAAVFAAGAPFPQLRSLSLLSGYGREPSHDRGALLALIRSETLRGLTTLSVTGVAGIDDAVAAALAESEALDSLKHLMLTDTAVGEAGALALAESPRLPRLRSVCLYRNPCALSLRAIDALRARFASVSL